VAADGGNLVYRASGFGQPPTRGFAQPMKGADVRQPGAVAGLREPRCERVRIERLAAQRHNEGHLRRRQGAEGGARRTERANCYLPLIWF
jgi:hypothetical protein